MSNYLKLFQTQQRLQNGNLSTTKKYSFDDLGDFIEERERIRRLLQSTPNAKLKIDYSSSFSNHTFFNSAVSKVDIAKSRILQQYPFDGNSEEKDAFFLSGTGYENYIYDIWPRYVGYVDLNGTTQYISASDYDNKLCLGTSSLYVSAWLRPVITTQNSVIQNIYRNSNILLQSENIVSPWSIVQATVVSNTTGTLDPFSGSNAFVLRENAVNNAHYIQQSVGITGSVSYVFSCWLKAANRSVARIAAPGATPTALAWFDLSAGTTGSHQNTTGQGIEDYGNGWYRCWLSFDCTSTANASFNILPGLAGETGNYAGVASQDAIFGFGVQISEQPTVTNKPTYYLKTTSERNVHKVGYELFLSSSANPHVKFALYSGSSTAWVSSSYVNYTASFNNVAAIYDKNASTLSLYINKDKIVSSSVSFGSLEFEPKKIFIGSGSSPHLGTGSYDFYSGSLDEIRVMHTASSLYHQKNYNRYVDSEDFVRLYYKFNEGSTGISSVDAGVVDYSKSAIHGVILNYASSARVSGSVLAEDVGDPILYSYHSSVVSFTSSLETSASLYDRDNRNMIFRLIPEDILLEDDQELGLLRTFSLAMARYFDEIKLYIDQFDNLRITNYDDVNETPDVLLPMLKRYFGWKVTDHFGDASPLEFFYGENIRATVSGNLTTPLLDIRNQFWRRTLNNLPYLYKTKGKRNNLDAFFNVLGINKNVLNVKEYGYTQGASIENNRLNREKVAYMLGIGTGSLGSLSSSFVKVPSLVTASTNAYTVEAMVQFPHLSATFSSSVVSGALWQFVDPNQVTGSFALLWTLQSLTSPSGTFILTGSDGQRFSSSIVTVFDGRVVNVAAGLRDDQKPFIEIRTLDGSTLTSSSFSGSVALSGIFTGSNFDFIVGANSGTYYTNTTQGYFGEVRYWTIPLSSSELDSHALHFESIGVKDPLLDNSKLKGHWSLGENKLVDSSGRINGIMDLSRNNMFATGAQFPASINPYKAFLLQYNYLSPTIDLKWTDNKIRIRNKSELRLSDVGKDTNEVSLEFNLVDALNEDISKIFSALDIMNTVIGAPINKYRDEYSDLEGYRRVYFERLSTNINFTNFFKLFRWFDKKLSDSIKQLLPARTKFIGGEQVVESHFLERNRYGYRYPVFRTPKNIGEGTISGSARLDAGQSSYFEAQPIGTFTSTKREEDSKRNALRVSPGLSIVRKDGTVSSAEIVNTFTYGKEESDRNKYANYQIFDQFYRLMGLFTASVGFLQAPMWVNKIAIGDSDALRDITRLANSGSLTRVYAVGPGNNGSLVSSSLNVLYSPDGGKLWLCHNIVSGGAGGQVAPRYDARSVAIDGSGSVYVVGTSASAGSTTVPAWVAYKGHITASYTDWTKIDGFDVSVANDVVVDSSGRILVCGASGSSFNMWMVRRSHMSQSNSWTTVDSVASLSQALAITVQNNVIYVAGGAIIRTSSDGGDTWGQMPDPGMYVKDIKVDVSGAIYVVGSGSQGTVMINGWQVRKSHVTASSVWTVVDHTGTVPYGWRANAISIDPRDINKIHVVGAISSSTATSSLGLGDGSNWLYRTSSDGGATWGNVEFRALDLDYYSFSPYPNGGHLRAVVKTENMLMIGGRVHNTFGVTHPIDPFIYNPSNVLSSIKGTTHVGASRPFFKVKVNGDLRDSVVHSEESINFRNECSRQIITKKDRDNE